MLILFLLCFPMVTVFYVCTKTYCKIPSVSPNVCLSTLSYSYWSNKSIKSPMLKASVLVLFTSFIIFTFFDLSSNIFQFVQESPNTTSLDLYMGIDGLSLYFVLLTTIVMPISFLSNSKSISTNLKLLFSALILLETLLLLVFLVLDMLLYYIFFESILPPLFILIGSFGSINRVRASFYLFLYTLLGSLFLLLSIVKTSSLTGITDFDVLYKWNIQHSIQIFLFCGIFIAFAVKTPVMFLNNWLLKAHVESPLSGSIILAGVVLKLSLYGILRLILPILAKAYLYYTFSVYAIGAITILYAGASTIRTIDVKELIAYSSVSHAAVYLMAAFSNTIQGLEGSITLALGHGFVSSGLFICAGGVLYDRSSTRLISHYRGIAQIMPMLSIMFFILCLGNCGAPLTLNFVGEFLSLYGTFERLPLLGVLASTSIIYSAAYTISMFNKIAFAGSYSRFFDVNLPDLNKREYFILLTLVLFTLVLGVYPAAILDGLHYSVTTLLYSFSQDNFALINLDYAWPFLFISICEKFYNCIAKALRSVLYVFNRPPKPHSFIHVEDYGAYPSPLPFGVPHTFVLLFGLLFAMRGIVEFGTTGLLETPASDVSAYDEFRFIFDMSRLLYHMILNVGEEGEIVAPRIRFVLERLTGYREVFVSQHNDNPHLVRMYDHVISLLDVIISWVRHPDTEVLPDNYMEDLRHSLYLLVHHSARGDYNMINERLLMWNSNPLRAYFGDISNFDPIHLYRYFLERDRNR